MSLGQPGGSEHTGINRLSADRASMLMFPILPRHVLRAFMLGVLIVKVASFQKVLALQRSRALHP